MLWPHFKHIALRLHFLASYFSSEAGMGCAWKSEFVPVSKIAEFKSEHSQTDVQWTKLRTP